MKIINNVQPLLGQYDLVIIDQWGVLHNGITAFEGAIAALTAMAKHGSKIIILSNSGKVAAHSYRLIERMGFDMQYVLKVISSGEAARQWLKNKSDPKAKNLGKKFIFWGFDDDLTAIAGLGLTEVQDINQADFIVAAGTGRGSLAAYQAEMDIALKNSIPMICTNPDLVANNSVGGLKICPGTLAQYYEEHGGEVVRFGKPAREIYNMCHALVPAAKKIIGIGDSLDHDIQGANNFGVDSLFVLSGIHRADFVSGKDDGKVIVKPEQIDLEKLQILTKKHAAVPNFVAPSFSI